jgi:hypothetical protein
VNVSKVCRHHIQLFHLPISEARQTKVGQAHPDGKNGAELGHDKRLRVLASRTILLLGSSACFSPA